MKHRQHRRVILRSITRKISFAKIALGLISLCFATGCTQIKNQGEHTTALFLRLYDDYIVRVPIVATLDGYPITLSEITRYASIFGIQIDSDSKRQDLLNVYLQERRMDMIAEKMHLDATDDYKIMMGQAKHRALMHALIKYLKAHELQVSNREIQYYIQQNGSEFRPRTIIKVGIIKAGTLPSKGESFERLASTTTLTIDSNRPTSEIENIALRLKVGAISSPIRTKDGGYIILKKYEENIQTPPPQSSSNEEVRQIIFGKKYSEWTIQVSSGIKTQIMPENFAVWASSGKVE